MTAEAMRTLSPRTAGEADLALGAESAADWIPLGRIAEHLPRGPGGKRTNRSTIWRWITRGCGGVRLATILVGRRRWTTRQAVREFVAATTAAGEPEMTVAEVREARRAQRANLAYLRRHGFSVAETAADSGTPPQQKAPARVRRAGRGRPVPRSSVDLQTGGPADSLTPNGRP